MKSLKLTEQGDLEFDGNRALRTVEGAAEQRQAIRLLLETVQGEWFLSTRHGLDYRDVWGAKWPRDRDAIRAAMTEAFAQEPRIEEIATLEIEYDQQERRLAVYFELRMEGATVADTVEVG